MQGDALHLFRPVAGVLLGSGALLCLAGLAMAGQGSAPRADALLVAGGLMLLAGGWQLWLMRRARAVTQRLAARLQLLDRAVQNAGSPVLVTDNDLTVQWCNQVFERETGYRLDEVLGRRIGGQLRSPHADPVTVERIRDAVRHHADIDIELLHRYRDGKDLWVRVQLSAQRDAAGRSAGFVAVLINIDAQVRAREAMRRALRHKSSLMRSLDEYVIVAETDVQGRFTRVNQRFQDITGYSEAELLDQRFQLIGSGWHTTAFWRDMWTRIGRGQPWQGEICNRSKQGRLFWVQTLVAPFLGPDGRVEKFVCIQSDITAHRMAQIELSKSESLLRRTSQLAGVGGWTVLLDGGLLQMTPECRELLGVREGELTSVDELWRCFAPGARLSIRAQLRELVEGRRDEVDELAALRPMASAQTRWVRLVASLRTSQVEGVGRMPGRITGAVQDYTPQMQAQQRIREEQRILHSAMDAAGEAFALFDPEQRLVYSNDAYSTWLPPDRRDQEPPRHEEVLRWIADSGTFPEAVGREADWVQEVLRIPVAGEPERVRQTADGRWFRFIDRMTPDGHRVVLRSDVTELQTALVRADAAAVSKGQFLANMSHEIRTPINAVMGLLQLLRQTPLAPQQADMVGKSLGAARSLLDILNDILDFSKIEAGKMALHAVPFRLSDLRRELEVILAGARGSKALDLLFAGDDDLPEVLVGDPVRLKQVLINLGGNAVKFTASGQVRLRWWLIAREGEHLRVHFEVSDTGIGIAPEQQERIFDSFSQGEASTARRFGGSGLGLTISQRLVALMGGCISLASEPGVGSTFAFDIDLLAGSEADLPAPRAPQDGGADQGPRLQGLRLLLAEDNALNQEVALAMLRREGAVVVLAENGQQAVDALADDPEGFDAVLMDMQMPVLDGLQATERIRETLGLRELPIIAMTANAMQQDRERCLQAGMNAHVGKPFDLDPVVALILRFTGAAALAAPADPVACGDSGAMPVWREDSEALRRLGGNAPLLAQLRTRFTATADECMRRAQACARRAEWPAVADALHQLKGAAAVVGASRLAQDCAALEQPLRNGSERADAGAVQQQLHALADTVRASLQALQAPAAPPALPEPTDRSAPDRSSDMAACLAGLRPLKTALENADMTVIDEHEQWMERYPAAQDARFRAFNRHMEVLDFPAAARCCAVLLGEASAAMVDAP